MTVIFLWLCNCGCLSGQNTQHKSDQSADFSSTFFLTSCTVTSRRISASARCTIITPERSLRSIWKFVGLFFKKKIRDLNAFSVCCWYFENHIGFPCGSRFYIVLYCTVLYCSTIACRKDIINLITLIGVKKAIFSHFFVLNAFVRFLTFGFFRQKKLLDHLNCVE